MGSNEVLLTVLLCFQGGRIFFNFFFFFCLASVYKYPFTPGLVWWVYREKVLHRFVH